MNSTAPGNELFELNFDFSSKKKAFNVSALISPSRLTLLDDADTPEKIQATIPYTVNEILEGSLEKKLGEIINAQDALTKNYSKAICGMVSMILFSEVDLREHFPEGNFHFKANSLKKITLQ